MSIKRAQVKRITTHPGEMLREEFMKPHSLSANALASKLRIPVTRINDIVREKRGVSADTALRLALCFGTTPEFWMNLQTAYELSRARRNATTLAREVLTVAS